MKNQAIDFSIADLYLPFFLFIFDKSSRNIQLKFSHIMFDKIFF